MEVNVETVGAAATAAAAIGGFMTWFVNKTLDAKLSRSNMEMLELINGKYLRKETAEERHGDLCRRVESLEERS